MNCYLAARGGMCACRSNNLRVRFGEQFLCELFPVSCEFFPFSRLTRAHGRCALYSAVSTSLSALKPGVHRIFAAAAPPNTASVATSPALPLTSIADTLL